MQAGTRSIARNAAKTQKRAKDFPEEVRPIVADKIAKEIASRPCKAILLEFLGQQSRCSAADVVS